MRMAVAASLLVSVSAVLVLAQTTSRPDFRNVTFSTSANPLPQNLPSSAEVTEYLHLITAYEHGVASVKTYREPVLTRGAQGIALFRSASPAVVLVVVGRVANGDFDPTGEGTGVIVDPRGYVLTNWHVIRGANAGMIFLKPASGDDLKTAPAYVAQLLYESATQDLALLKMVNAPTNLPFLKVANMSQVQVAEDIHIIGHPHGKLWSYSTGVVSQVRTGFTWSYSDGSSHEAKVLQMQTAINPGNSGGPVLDDSGAILGLVAMSEEGQNLNYAVAADEIASFLQRGMTVRSRGPHAPAAATPSAALTGKDREGHTILKLIYAGMDFYVIEDSKGAPTELFVETVDGTELHATTPNQISGFNTWVATLPGGNTVRASGKSGSPEKMQAESSPPKA